MSMDRWKAQSWGTHSHTVNPFHMPTRTNDHVLQCSTDWREFWWLFIQVTFRSIPLLWFSFVNGDENMTPTINPTMWPTMNYMVLLCAFSSLRAPQRPLSSGFWTYLALKSTKLLFSFQWSPPLPHWTQNLKVSPVGVGEMAQRLSACWSSRGPEFSL